MNTLTNKIIPMMISALFSTHLYADSQSSEWLTLMDQYRQTELEKFSAKKNLSAFQDYLDANPENALVALYVGSSYCLVARDAWMPWNKIDAVNTCVDKMEVAYQDVQTQYGKNSTERLSADLSIGLTSAGLPDSFKQQQVTVDTLKHAMQHPAFTQLPNRLQTQVTDTLAAYQDQ